jgi:hypothetical protein
MADGVRTVVGVLAVAHDRRLGATERARLSQLADEAAAAASAQP